MKKFTFLTVFLFAALLSKAGDTIQIRQWAIANPIVLQQPVINDTVNIFGAKCDEKFLIKTTVTDRTFNNNLSTVNAGADGSVEVPNLAKGTTALYFMSFDVTATAYTKANFVIKAPHTTEVYVNGDKFEGASLKLEPRTYRINIKGIQMAADTVTPSVKAFLVVDKKDAVKNLSVAAQNTKRPMNMVDIMEGERPSRVSISPDGKYMLSVAVISMSKNKQKALYKLFDYTSGKLIMSAEDRGWSWMPNGSRLYYTLDTDNGKALMLLDVATMQESKLADNLPDGYFSWSPDESYLIFTVNDKAPENRTGVNQIITPQDRQGGWRNRSFLSRYDMHTGAMQPLTFGYRSTYLVDISPDSKTIIYTTSRDNYTERPFSLSSYYMLNLETMKVDTLWSNVKYGSISCFSPDGKQLLLMGGPEAFGGVGRDPKLKAIPNSYDMQAYLYDIASKKIKPISLDFNPSLKSASWNRVDNNIYFTADDEDRVSCYRYATKTGKFEKLPLPVDIVQQFSIADNALSAAFVGQSVSYPAQLFKFDVKANKSAVFYNPLKERVEQMALGEVKDWNFRSTQGDDIKGYFYVPYNFDPAKKYPLIVYYYGGTTPVTRTFDSRYPFHLYAAMGYVVYVLQPSGTIGFGQQFSAWHVNAWGQRTADDIIDGTKKFCDAHSFVDRSKVGCLGASYGGFMTMYLQTRTDIFAAAVSHAGISDVTSYWGEGYWGYAYNAVAASDSYPWNNKEVFVNQSPLFAADKVKTPILLLHGAADTNVPVGESVQMFTALKILGKQAELITFDGENHFIMDADKRIAWQNSIFAWFARWLQNDDTWWNEMYPDKKL